MGNLTQTGGAVSKRPSRYSPEINRAIAKELAPKVAAHLCLTDDDELMALEDDIAAAVDNFDDDGYCIAKHLDDNGFYDVDAALAEILDDTSHLRGKFWREAQKAWVEETGIQPPPVGAKVKSSRPHKKSAGIGIVVRNEPYGQSVVRFPDLGHVEEGRFGTQGTYIEWEALEVLPEVAP